MPSLYDPNCEETESEKVVAARWELLRRNSDFIAVAEEWVSSPAFRQKHSHDPSYRNLAVHRPRCALDWMLTPRERFELATFQKASLLLLPDPRFNFGPVSFLRRPGATARTRADFRECIELVPLKSEEPILHLDDAWPQTPPLFREQFRLACGELMECTDINAELSTMVNLMQRAANRLGTGDPLGEMRDIALWLESTAIRLRKYAEFSKVFVLPKQTITDRTFEMWVSRMRQALEELNLISHTKKFELHKSYLGTEKEWRWFLESERLNLDLRKSADLIRLTRLYCEELRSQKLHGSARKNVKLHGFTGSAIPLREVRNRRSTVKKHIRSIEHWIGEQYPPKPANEETAP